MRVRAKEIRRARKRREDRWKEGHKQAPTGAGGAAGASGAGGAGGRSSRGGGAARSGGSRSGATRERKSGG